MYRTQFYLMEDRALREQDLAERMDERRKYTRADQRLSLRARAARRLFALAVAIERQETWKMVSERLEAKGCL